MRRTRYTVKTNAGLKVIRAYPDQEKEILKYYEDRGFSVFQIIKGDLAKEANHREIKAKGGFKVNQAKLKEAIAMLGIELPVDIRFHGRVGSVNGNHRLRNKTHVIMLKSYLTPEKASSTLWHELTHAMQAEKAQKKGQTWGSVITAQKQYSYSKRPIEIEARAMSKKMAHFKLCN